MARRQLLSDGYWGSRHKAPYETGGRPPGKSQPWKAPAIADRALSRSGAEAGQEDAAV